MDDDEMARRFRRWILSRTYPCLGAAAAIRAGHYRFERLGSLGSAEAAERGRRGLVQFGRDHPERTHPVAVYVAAFDDAYDIPDDVEFESLLWRTLQQIHDADDEPRWWAEAPEQWNDELAFVVDGRNYFVVGLHPRASRLARRFPVPLMAFNALSHMDAMIKTGQYERLTEKIRERDVRLQGSTNPNLGRIQVAQFSGREVPDGWRCPLRPRPRADAAMPSPAEDRR